MQIVWKREPDSKLHDCICDKGHYPAETSSFDLDRTMYVQKGAAHACASALSKTFLRMFSSFEAEKQSKVDFFSLTVYFPVLFINDFLYRAAAFPFVPLTFSAGFLASCLHHSAATATLLRAFEL